MTRKDYLLISAALRAARNDCEEDPEFILAHRICCEHVAAAIREDNRAFDDYRFLEDCGVRP